MAMQVGPSDDDDAPMADINTTPLVDVMLVMLIIFLITVPVVIQTVPLELPKVSSMPTTTKPENVLIAVNNSGDIFWGVQRLDSKQELFDKAQAHRSNCLKSISAATRVRSSATSAASSSRCSAPVL